MPRRAAPARPHAKHWIFTLNNPRDNAVVFDDQTHIYLIAGNEIAPGTGTPHIQGYVCFKQRKRLSAVKRWLPTAHWEIMRGTPFQASNYCKKDGNFTEYGELPKSAAQVNRLRMQQQWDEAYASAKRHQLEEIPKHMLVRCYHAFKRIQQDNPIIPDDLAALDNYWIVAPTGYGKSRYARERWPDFYDKSPNKWFVGYKNQKTILCDDFGPKQCEYLGWYIKRWADLYSFPMETKGGGHQIRPDRMVVTSQYQIDECFEDELVREAIERRFITINLLPWEQRLLMTDEELDPPSVSIEMDDTRTTQSYDAEELDEEETNVFVIPDPDQIDLTLIFE